CHSRQSAVRIARGRASRASPKLAASTAPRRSPSNRKSLELTSSDYELQPTPARPLISVAGWSRVLPPPGPDPIRAPSPPKSDDLQGLVGQNHLRIVPT